MGWVPSEPASSPQDACLAHPPLREVSAGVVGHVEASRIPLRQQIAACGVIECNRRWAHLAPRCMVRSSAIVKGCLFWGWEMCLSVIVEWEAATRGLPGQRATEPGFTRAGGTGQKERA